MSIGSTAFTCVWVDDNLSYSGAIMGSETDLVQLWTGELSGPSVADSWAAKPIYVDIVVMCSDASIVKAGIASKVLAADWYINDVEITFDNSKKSKQVTTGAGTIPAGTFERIDASDGNADHIFGALKIKDDLVKYLGGINSVLKAVIPVEKGNTAINITASTPIRFVKVSSDALTAEIYCEKPQSMTLSEESGHQSVTLKARIWRGVTDVTSSYPHKKWYVYDDSLATPAWVNKPANSSGNLVITRDDVASYLQVLVAFFNDATETDISKAVITDIQTVADSGDTLTVHANPTPADGTLYASDSSVGGVTFNPTVKDSNDNVKANIKFKFACFSPAGTLLNGTPSGTPGAAGGFDTNANGQPDNAELLTSYTVPREMFLAIETGPLVVISAFDMTST